MPLHVRKAPWWSHLFLRKWKGHRAPNHMHLSAGPGDRSFLSNSSLLMSFSFENVLFHMILLAPKFITPSRLKKSWNFPNPLTHSLLPNFTWGMTQGSCQPTPMGKDVEHYPKVQRLNPFHQQLSDHIPWPHAPVLWTLSYFYSWCTFFFTSDSHPAHGCTHLLSVQQPPPSLSSFPPKSSHYTWWISGTALSPVFFFFFFFSNIFIEV